MLHHLVRDMDQDIVRMSEQRIYIDNVFLRTIPILELEFIISNTLPALRHSNLFSLTVFCLKEIKIL